MKKQLTLVLSLAMLVGVGSSALAAYDKYDDKRAATEGWYTGTAHPHYIDGYVESKDDTTLVGAELYQNDHTFVGAEFANTKDTSKEFQAKGSYLFKNGFFAGAMLDYTKDEGVDEAEVIWQLWPGYRYSFDAGYVAGSLDIASHKEGDENKVQLQDIDLDALYFFDNGKVSGSAVIPLNEYKSFQLNVSGRLKFSPEIVAGADIYFDTADNLDISAGGTWMPLTALVVDGKLGYNKDLYYAASGMYMIQQFGFGLQVDNIEYSVYGDGPPTNQPLAEGMNLTLKAKYMITETDKAVLKFTIPTEEDEAKTITLAYEHYL